MAAPTPTARVAPPSTAIWIPDGFRTKYTLAADTNVALWEMEVKPSGTAGGEPIPQDSMWNTEWRIKRLQQLKEKKPATIKFLYDPILQSEIEDLVNVETTCTETYPDGTTYCYYGGMTDVEFDPLVPGQPGTGTATITPTNWDKTNKVEAGPVLTNVVGT